MTTVTIVAVHPAVTIVRTPDGQTEVPTAWFADLPKVGQEWTIELHHTATEAEKLDKLNAYLARD